jgi:RNase P subunit RPR2
MAKKPDERDNAPQAWTPPRIKCRRCDATIGLHTHIAAFDGKPAYQVYMCERCGFVEFIEAEHTSRL